MSEAQRNEWLAKEREKITGIGLSDIEKLRKAIAEGADVNNIYIGGSPILVAAAMSKETHLELVKLLLESGANPDSSVTPNTTPLWLAETYSRKRELALLLVKYGAKVTMYHAIDQGYTEKVAQLLEAGADPNALISPKRPKLWSMETNQFVDGSIDPSFIRTPLSYAESKRRKDIAMLLVNAGATMTLAHAVSQRYTDKVIEMLDAGADPNHGSPLAIAVSAGHTDLVVLLLSAGANITDDNLVQAVQKGHAAIVASLLHAGAKFEFEIPKGRIQKKVTLRFNPGLSGVSIAPSNEVEQDAFYITNSEGLLLIHLAAVLGNVEIISHLLKAGLDINSITKNGYTPLHCATLMGHIHVVKLLLDEGADTSLKATYENTESKAALFSASELATFKNHIEIAELIEKQNSIINTIISTLKNLF